MSENDVELLTNVLPWTPVERTKQYLILLLETVKFWVKDLLTDVEIEMKSELEDLEIKGCSGLFNFSKLKSGKIISNYIKSWKFTYIRIFMYIQIISKIGQRISKALLPKVMYRISSTLFTFLHFCEVSNLHFLFTLFFSEQKISGTKWFCQNEIGGTILLLQNNKWFVSELKEGNSLG